MFSTSTPATSGRRTRGNCARQSLSRAGSVAGLAGLSDGGTPPPTSTAAGTSNNIFGTRSRRTGPISSRKASLLPSGRTPSRAASRASAAIEQDRQNEQDLNAVLGSTDEQDDIAWEEQGLLLKTDTHTVMALGGTHLSNIPTEVREILLNSDFYTEPYMALLEPIAGYACLVGRQHCHAWSLPSANTASTCANQAPPPTCYTFPLPQTPAESLSATVLSPVPFVHFVSLGSSSSSPSSSREPGLLTVSGSGQCWYWNTITAALSSPDRFINTQIPLVQSEVIRCTGRLTPTHYLLGTSGGRIFSVKIASPYSSSASVTCQQMTKVRGVLARVGNYFGGAAIDIRGGISTLACRPASASVKREGQSWEVCALSNDQIEYWKISDSGAEFQHEQDLQSLIIAALRRSRGSSSSISNITVVDSSFVLEELLILVSFMGPRSTAASSQQSELSYALIFLHNHEVRRVQALAFTHQVDLRPMSHPRLNISDAAALAYVTLPDLIVFASLSEKTPFEENVSLKNSAKNRILGLAAHSGGQAVALAAHTGLIEIAIDLGNVHTAAQRVMHEDPVDLATRNLTRKLEQAVLFADNHRNPLAFDVTLGDKGDLVTAAESVSREITTNAGRLLPAIIDVRTMLADRLARSHFLMRHLHDNNLMPRLSKTSKRHLAWDAERLAAAAALWQLHNADPSGSVLSEAIASVPLLRNEENEGVRAFYRYHTHMLPQVLEALKDQLHKRVKPSSLPIAERSIALLDINRCLAGAFKATLRHRTEFGQLYGVPLGPDAQTCLSEPWSSRPALLHTLREVFEATFSLVQERTNTLGTVIDQELADSYGLDPHADRRPSQEREQHLQQLLKSHLVDLADYSLAMHQERLSYLQSLSENAAATTELRALLDIYVGIRPQIIQRINALGRINAAYDLAQRYRDFQSLVDLCNDPAHGSPAQIHFFLEKYKEDFAFPLFDWLLANGRTHDLMVQDVVYNTMLAKYLRERQLYNLSWMLEISLDRPDNAADALLHQANSEMKLDDQKLLLSLGKLARVAGCTRDQVDTSEGIQHTLGDVDAQLDIVASHDRLAQLCDSVLDSRDRLRPVEMQATVLLGKLCANIQDQELVKLGCFLFRRLLLGDALTTEDLVDLYSMKDNQSDEQAIDFSYALDLLGRDRHTPPARTAIAAKAVWRRVYLHDNWAEIRRLAVSSSDETLANALRNTSLYITLAAGHSGVPAQWTQLRPSEAVYLSTPDEESSLQSRFSNVAYDGVINSNLVSQSYMRDSRRLQAMIEDKTIRLEEFFDETLRLVGLQTEAGAGRVVSDLGDSYMEV